MKQSTFMALILALAFTTNAQTTNAQRKEENMARAKRSQIRREGKTLIR